MATIKFWGDSEIRTNDDSSIDEIVVPLTGQIHLEQMDTGVWLMTISSYEATESLYITLGSSSQIRCAAETDLGEVSVGFKS